MFFTIEEIKNFWQEYGRVIFGVLVIVYTAMSFLMGMVGPPKINPNLVPRTCKATSVWHLINFPHRLGCELTKQRWGE